MLTNDLFLAVQNVRVWTLERVAYQQIMKTSAMKRFDERVGFLKSVPLMKDLNEEFLSKIADVLKEVYLYNIYSYMCIHVYMRIFYKIQSGKHRKIIILLKDVHCGVLTQ